MNSTRKNEVKKSRNEFIKIEKSPKVNIDNGNNKILNTGPNTTSKRSNVETMNKKVIK